MHALFTSTLKQLTKVIIIIHLGAVGYVDSFSSKFRDAKKDFAKKDFVRSLKKWCVQSGLHLEKFSWERGVRGQWHKQSTKMRGGGQGSKSCRNNI